MKRGGTWAVVLALLAANAAAARAQEAVAVKVDPSVRYQTILGWGKTTPWLHAPKLLHDQSIDRAVNDLGINRLRFEGQCGNKTDRRSWEWLNDNADPFRINWKGFDTATLDARVGEWLVPWKKAVEARGEKLDLYVSPSFFRGGSSGDVPPWLLANPDEYAEWALALLTRLRDVHGITADYYCICNEAGNNNAFTPQVVGRMIKALGPRMRKAGFPTTIEFPESINAHVAWRYVEALRNDPEIWKYVGVIAYHWYGRDNQSAMVKLRDFARQRRLPTAQTEFMNLTIDHLYDDMVLGGVSYWEIYGLATPDYKAALSHASSTAFNGGRWYWRFRQASHYVRPGAVRIECRSADAAVRCLAFERDGRATVVLINTGAPRGKRPVAVGGLAPGAYGVSRCVGRRPYEELGPQRVGADGVLAVELAPDSVTTLYPRDEANAAPTVTEWRAKPDFLTLPAARVQLSCGATDPELDKLSYNWSVVSQPEGARVAIEKPDAASTPANGLGVASEYVFAVRVGDGANEVTREVMLRVFDGNQAPVPMDVHNRIPVQVRVKDGGTLLRGGAWDIEDDPVTYRWSIVRQPVRAAAQLKTPTESPCRVEGMTVAGDYVFRLEISDPTHTVAVEHTVPVYP